MCKIIDTFRNNMFMPIIPIFENNEFCININHYYLTSDWYSIKKICTDLRFFERFELTKCYDNSQILKGYIKNINDEETQKSENFQFINWKSYNYIEYEPYEEFGKFNEFLKKLSEKIKFINLI